MPWPKKHVLKQRVDGFCKYKGIQFMGATSEEALAEMAADDGDDLIDVEDSGAEE